MTSALGRAAAPGIHRDTFENHISRAGSVDLVRGIARGTPVPHEHVQRLLNLFSRSSSVVRFGFDGFGRVLVTTTSSALIQYSLA